MKSSLEKEKLENTDLHNEIIFTGETLKKISESHSKEIEEKEEEFKTELRKKEEKLDKSRKRYKQAETATKEKQVQIKSLK